MKVAFVTGGRDHTPTEAQAEQFDALIRKWGIECIVHGDCPTGVDAWAKNHAQLRLGLWSVGVPAPWERFGKAAGPKRNSFATRLAWMLSGPELQPLAIVFPGGRGTSDAALKARRSAFRVEAIDG